MLCMFAQHFPGAVAKILQRGEGLKRKFREETITDLLMANLVTLGGTLVRVEYPDEPTTGADMEWNFINRDNNEFFQILLQAKRLTESNRGWDKNWYKELFYRPKTSGILQVDTLCQTAKNRASYPCYILYNYAEACRLAHHAGALNFLGINLVEAHLIQRLATASSTAKLAKRNSSVGTLYPLLFPLTDIFCPSNLRPLGLMAFAGRYTIPTALSFGPGGPTFGVPLPPRPDQVRNRLLDIRKKVSEVGDRAIDLPRIPDLGLVPPDLRYLVEELDWDGTTYSKGLDHWRLTFFSYNPTDEFGRPIKQA